MQEVLALSLQSMQQDMQRLDRIGVNLANAQASWTGSMRGKCPRAGLLPRCLHRRSCVRTCGQAP